MAQFSFCRIFADQVKVARFWFVLFLLTVAGAGAAIWRLSAAFEKRSQVLVIDSTTRYITRTLDFTEATALHEAQVYDAAQSLFDSGPQGPDHSERLKRLFEKKPYQKALAGFQTDAEEFRAKEIHQKVEVAEINLVQVKDESVLATFDGQLIRSGMFGGKPLVEVLAVKGRITFVRNPNMVANGAFPTVVREYEVETQPVSPK